MASKKRNSKRPPKTELTLKQLEAARECAVHGLGYLVSFLRHDDWDCELNKKERYAARSSDRFFEKTINMLDKKIRKLKK